jgi:hypothetical protein
MGFDTRELRQFTADLEVAGAKVVPAAAKVLEVNALRVQKAWRSSARGHARFPSFPSSVTVDIRGLTAEVGPDKSKRQGALGNLLHFGTSKSGPTLPNPQTYLDAAQPKFEADLAALASRLLGGGGPAPTPDAGDSTPTATGRDSRGRFVKGG